MNWEDRRKNSIDSIIKSSVLGKLNLRVSPSENVKEAVDCDIWKDAISTYHTIF